MSEYYLDVIFTGESEDDEILQIMIKDDNQDTIYIEQFKPLHKKIWPDAQLRFGINQGHVQNARSVEEAVDKVQEILQDASKIITFDWPHIHQQFEKVGLSLPSEAVIEDVAVELALQTSNVDKRSKLGYFDQVPGPDIQWVPKNEQRMYQICDYHVGDVDNPWRDQSSLGTGEDMINEEVQKFFKKFQAQLKLADTEDFSLEDPLNKPQKQTIYVRTFGCGGCLIPILITLLIFYFLMK